MSLSFHILASREKGLKMLANEIKQAHTLEEQFLNKKNDASPNLETSRTAVLDGSQGPENP